MKANCWLSKWQRWGLKIRWGLFTTNMREYLIHDGWLVIVVGYIPAGDRGCVKLRHQRNPSLTFQLAIRDRSPITRIYIYIYACLSRRDILLCASCYGTSLSSPAILEFLTPLHPSIFLCMHFQPFFWSFWMVATSLFSPVAQLKLLRAIRSFSAEGSLGGV